MMHGNEHMRRSAVLSATLAGLLVLVLGCRSERSPTNRSTSSDSGSAPAAPSPIRYVVCPQRDAETAIVVELKVPNVLTHRRVYGLRKEKECNDHGTLLPLRSNSSWGLGCADGPDSSHIVSICIWEHHEYASESQVVAKVSCSWSVSGKEGEVRRDIVVPVGEEVKVALDHGAEFTASFRKPWPAPTADEVPRLVRELEGPDSNDAIWNLVEIGEPAIPALVEAIRGEPKDRRPTAIWALGHIARKSEKAVPGILESLQSADRDVRLKAAHVCLWIPGRPILQALENATKDSDAEIAKAAKWTLDHKNRTHPPTQPVLESQPAN